MMTDDNNVYNMIITDKHNSIMIENNEISMLFK